MMKQALGIILIFVITSGCNKKQNNNMLGDNVKLYKNTPAWELAQAVEKEDTIKIKELCQKDTSLLSFQEKKFGQTILEWAVYTNHYYSAKALCEAGANPNIQSYDGSSAFLQAADNSETSDYVKLLLKYGGDVNAIAQPKAGIQQIKTPLIAACCWRFETVKILVEAGADINYTDDQHQSPLQRACLFDEIETVKYLLEKGAEFKKPLSYTIDDKPLYIQDYLRDMTFDINSDEYKIKMKVVVFLKDHGIDYWATPIPEDYHDKYSKEYLEKY